MTGSMVRCRLSSVSLQTVAFLISLSASVTSAESGVQAIDFTKMAELPVLLTSEEGKPVAGAEVMPYAMRMIEQQGHGYWNQAILGPPKSATSGEDGIAVIKYPIHVQGGTQTLTTRLVTFVVTHTDFVKSVVHFDLGPKQAQVMLKAGCEVQLSAVDPDGNRIDNFGVAMAGPYAPDSWAKADLGVRRTRSINDGTWQTMMVKTQVDGPTLFSDVLPLRVRPGQRVRVRNLGLTPGAKVRGTLSDEVPRPVAGYAIATSVPDPAEDSWSDKDPSLAWHDWVNVSEEGTFEFESLPRGGQVQIIGIGEGWISSTTVPDARVFVMGQLFDVDKEQVEIELEMEPTGTLEVKLVTEDGKPFTEGRVGSWPNQRYYKGGSMLLGQRYRSKTMIENQFLPSHDRLPITDPELVVPYSQPVGKDGVAILKGLPIGRSLGITLGHERFKLAAKDDRNGRGEARFELPSAKPVRMEVTVVATAD